ncbi:MAG: alcohol dehydrogenase [Synergistaceae bacterium]|jgi:ribosomal protein S27AE|nr:alcohol dehydrogenase [Synergistaceae bacterium]
MLIVGCQTCGEAKILAGTPDRDGIARVNWTCRRCGTGQVLQLDVQGDARNEDLRNLLGGLDIQKRRAVKSGISVDFQESLDNRR